MDLLEVDLLNALKPKHKRIQSFICRLITEYNFIIQCKMKAICKGEKVSFCLQSQSLLHQMILIRRLLDIPYPWRRLLHACLYSFKATKVFLDFRDLKVNQASP